MSPATQEEHRAVRAIRAGNTAVPEANCSQTADAPQPTSLFAGADLVLLISHMADSGEYSLADLAYAVEKPHKFVDVLVEARAAVTS